MDVEERIPAQVFHLAEFLSDEIQARGWTTTDVAARMSDTDEEFPKYPGRRAEFTPPESIFGPISRRALFHIVKPT